MTDEVAAPLREIRDGQQPRLERQPEALAMQREQFEIIRGRFAGAGQLQDTNAAVIGFTRKLMLLIGPLIVLLVALMPWMVFR